MQTTRITGVFVLVWATVCAFALCVTPEQVLGAETPTIYELNLSPDRLYTHDDKKVRFTAKLAESAESNLSERKVILVQLPTGNKKKRNLGLMTDSGFMGDQRPGDGVISRKVSYKEKKAKMLSFQLQDLESGNVVSNTIHLTIERRPNFIETLGLVWKKITN